MFPAELHDDDGFRELEEGPQRLFMWLWIHPDLNTAGVIAVQLDEWASAAKGLTPDLIDCYIKVLQAEDWIDYEDGQLWLRPFMKYDGALKSHTTYVNAARAVKTVRSRRLRTQIWDMFRTFPLPLVPIPDDEKKARQAESRNESVQKAWAELEQRMARSGVRESLPAPEGDHLHHHLQLQHQHAPSDPPSDTPSHPPSGPSSNGSRTVPERLCTYGCDAPAVPGKQCCGACVRTGRS
ncbi:hypothetical protein ACRU44_04485 [Mycobacterium colombiense]